MIAAQPRSQHDDVFERRLADARALGDACNGLARQSPDLSAKGGLSFGQRAGGWALLGVLAGFVFLAPGTLLAVALTLTSTLFSVIITTRIAAALSAFFSRIPPETSRAPDDQLPRLTILAALYREANVVSALVRSLDALDYPRDRLDIKLLIEADDDPTINALRAIHLPPQFEIVPVPPAEPRTKPKALNYGLASARGEIIAVFDAEDRPSPEQPRQAAAAFATGPRNLFAVQAPLAIHNGADGWMQRQFEIEYGIHFSVWLPFLSRLGAPIPLGGTSNYFKRDKLVSARGWDAWNVTEDADLGMRIARKRGAVAMIHAPTYEEAPARLGDWLGQRTRWMKGHMQTWLVLMRNPLRAINEMGFGAFLAAQVTLGGSLLASSVHAPLLLWMLLGVATPLVSLEGWHAALFGLGYGSAVLATIAAKLHRASLQSLLLLPAYWPLVSLGMLCALWDLKVRPHFWAKTPHGVGPRHS